MYRYLYENIPYSYIAIVRRTVRSTLKYINSLLSVERLITFIFYLFLINYDEWSEVRSTYIRANGLFPVEFVLVDLHIMYVHYC